MEHKERGKLMVIVGDNTNTVGSLTITNNTGGLADWIHIPYKSPWAYPTTDGGSPVSNAVAENYINVLCPYRIEKVIFHDPATIIIWKDKSKTVVKRHSEPFDREKGLAMCIAKKVLREKFHQTFREWCEE